jgi:hypothetical protein
MNDPTVHGDDTRGLAALLQRAIDDEPPSRFSTAEQARRGRNASRRRTALVGIGAVATVAVFALGAVAALDLHGGATRATLAAASESAGPSELSKDTVAATIADELGVTFRTVTVQERMKMPSGRPALDLYGALADPTGDTAFVFAMVGADAGPTGEPTTPPTRRESAPRLPSCGSDFTVGNDGPPESAYVGTCHWQVLSNGTVVIWRSGRAPGGYARSAAMLGRADSSGVFAESTNQAIVDPRTCVENEFEKHCKVAAIVQPDPGVTAQALGALLTSLEPLTR